jgi:hypothetical protein
VRHNPRSRQTAIWHPVRRERGVRTVRSHRECYVSVPPLNCTLGGNLGVIAEICCALRNKV